MSQTELHLHQRTRLMSEQFIAGLTDFGPGGQTCLATAISISRCITSAAQKPTLPKVQAASGSACTMTGRAPTTSSLRRPTPMYGKALRGTPTTSRDSSMHDRHGRGGRARGQDLKGRLFGLVVRTVGGVVLERAFEDSVNVIDARNGVASVLAA